MVSEQQQEPDQQYIGVRECSSSWQAFIPAVPTTDGSEFSYESPPAPTAAAAAQQYDRLVIALLGSKFAVAGRNLNFPAKNYSTKDVKAAAQLLYEGNPHVLLDKNFSPLAAAVAVRGGSTAMMQTKKKRLHFDSDMSEGDWYDSAVAAAAGAAIAARRAAAAAARDAAILSQQQGQDVQPQKQLKQEQQQDTIQLAASRQATTMAPKPPKATAPPAAAGDDDIIIPSRKASPIRIAASGQLEAVGGSNPITSTPSTESWLHSLLQCQFLFQPCVYCSGKRMERPSAGRDKLIRFFNPADPGRGYCNYCPELPGLSGSLLSVGRVQHSSPHQYFIKMADVIKASSSSSSVVQIEDVSGIQTYPLSNGRVVFVNPRSQPQQQRQRQYKQGAWCPVDGRHLKDSSCRFCSISCKLEVESERGLNPEQQEGPVVEVRPAPKEEMGYSNKQLDTSAEPCDEAAAEATVGADEDGEPEHKRRNVITEAFLPSLALSISSELPTGDDQPNHQQQQPHQQQQQLLPGMIVQGVGDITQQQQQQQQQQLPGMTMEGAEDITQQQQQQGFQLLFNNVMQPMMPSGSQVPFTSDALGKHLVLPSAQPAAAAAAAAPALAVSMGAEAAAVAEKLIGDAAAAAAPESWGSMIVLQPAPHLLQ